MANDDVKASSWAKYKWEIFIMGMVLVGYSTYLEWRGLVNMRLFRYDYAFFYHAFDIVAHHQPAQYLYDFSREQAFLSQMHFPLIKYNQYVYPPQFAFFWSALGSLPFGVSADIWMALSVLSYALGVFWVARMLWPRFSLAGIWAVALAACILTPFQIDIGAGNVNSILFALLVLTFYLLHRRRPWLAGIPLGLAIAFKVTPMAVLVYLLLRKQWRVGVSSFIAVSMLSAGTILRLGDSPIFNYVNAFLTFGQTSMKNGPAPYNQSLLGTMDLLSRHHWLSWSIHAQSVAFLVFAGLIACSFVYVTRRTKANLRTDLALASLTPLLFSPLVEEMHMIFALPALMVLVRYVQKDMVSYPDVSRVIAKPLGLVVLACFAALSLPTTFILNSVVHRWPQLFWLQTEMFFVLILLFMTVAWTSLNKLHTDSNTPSKLAKTA